MDGLTVTVAGVLVLCVGITYFAIAFRSMRELRSIDDFFIFNGRLAEGGVFSATFAAEMSLATVFIAFMTLAAFMGIGLVWSILTFIIGQVILLVAIPAIKRRVKHGETLQTFLGTSYKSATLQVAASLVSVIGFVGLFAVEVIVGSTLFAGLSANENFYFAILSFISFLVIFYTVLGGFSSVVRTDKFQALAVLFAIGTLVYCAYAIGGADNPEGRLIPVELMGRDKLQVAPLLLLNFAMINVVYPICDMSAWQRVAAARDVNAARRGFRTAVVSFLVTWSCVVFAALSLTEFTAGQADGAALVAPLGQLASLGVIETILVGAAMAAFAAAMLSTGDTFLIAAAQSLAMDVRFRGFFQARRSALGSHPASADDEIIDAMASGIRFEEHAGISSTKVLGFARFSIIVMAVLGLVGCWFMRDASFSIADFVFVVYGSTVAFAPVISGAFFIKDADRLGRLSGWAVAALTLGLSAGWSYGILAVLSQDRGEISPIARILEHLLGTMSAYNSPTVAVATSAFIYTTGIIFVRSRNMSSVEEADA